MDNKLNILIILAIVFIYNSCKDKNNNKANSNKSDSTKVNELLFAEFQNESCVKGKDSAQAEARKGSYTYVIPGLVNATDFNKFYSRYLKKNYKVRLITNCDGPPIQPTKLDCYYSQANIEVKLKYGKDFIERTKNEAKVLYKRKYEDRE